MWGLFYLCDQTPIFVFKSKVKLGARNASGVSQSVSQSSGHEFRDESRLTNGCPSIYPSVRRHFFMATLAYLFRSRHLMHFLFGEATPSLRRGVGTAF